MKIRIITDGSGKVIAAHRLAKEGQARTGIRPAMADHTLHQVEQPAELAKLPLHEVVKRFRLDGAGRPAWISNPGGD
jgi:hypothetical protein